MYLILLGYLQVFGKNKTCAIVTESKCLLTNKYGKKIDSHDVVLR